MWHLLSFSKGRSELRRHLKGHSEELEDLAMEMPARGLSVRDIEDAYKDETGRLLLSRTAVSRLGERLWADYQEFAGRDLGEYDITYLLVDGIAERVRPGQRREPVLAAWGFTAEGKKALLALKATQAMQQAENSAGSIRFISGVNQRPRALPVNSIPLFPAPPSLRPPKVRNLRQSGADQSRKPR